MFELVCAVMLARFARREDESVPGAPTMIRDQALDLLLS